MLYLTGVTNARVVELAKQQPRLGLLPQPGNSNHLQARDYAVWAVDNGCFVTRPNAKPFDVDAYIEGYLPKVAAVGGALFATVPDVVGDHAATVERSTPLFARVRAAGVPAAFCAQNGAENDPALPWDSFDCLFLGGVPECLPCGWVRPALDFAVKACPECGRKLTEWKVGAGAARLVREAKARGKWVHMGRVNSWKRMKIAWEMGCDSADGTYLGFGPDKNLPKVKAWLEQIDELAAAQTLPMAA